MSGTRIPDVFWACADAMTRVVLMDRTKADKEFHFQRWFEARLTEAGIAFDNLGRNSYPDYVLPTTPEGYEVKGLAYPGREQSFDCNRYEFTARNPWKQGIFWGSVVDKTTKTVIKLAMAFKNPLFSSNSGRELVPTTSGRWFMSSADTRAGKMGEALIPSPTSSFVTAIS